MSGCSLLLRLSQPKILKSYKAETAPSQIAKAGDGWAMLLSTYADADYTIAVSEDLDSLSDIYTVSDVSIWYFDANEKGIAWCEESEHANTFKVYNFATKNVETISTVSFNEEFQPENIGIFRNNVYYCVIDYAQNKVQAVSYNIETKTSSIIHSVALKEENQPYTINLNDEYLSFNCSNRITVLNVETNQTVYDAALPGSVVYVYTASYDSINDTCAIYYADSDSEDIGILKEGETEILSLYTFAEHHYAYKDKIECYNGHIYWIWQANVSGRVSDHYQLFDYNYLKHTPLEISRTFALHRDGNDLYLLRFNQNGDYTHIDLCKK